MPKKLIQTRLHIPDSSDPKHWGNCLPTVLACLMDIDNPEDVIQIQEVYLNKKWEDILQYWLACRGYTLVQIEGHLSDDSFYLVTGMGPRGANHICIYQNGELWHDPHPDQNGLLEESYFQQLQKIEWEDPDKIQYPTVREHFSENYARIVEDSAGITHYWTEDGKYDGWAGAPCTDFGTQTNMN